MGHFLQLHETPDLFREALRSTEAQSGFTQRLIEKDYYCSVVLADFEPLFDGGLVFKGGTSLSKVHAEFYRLSEDLDFAISIPTTARRRDRRGAVAPVKRHLAGITKRRPAISVSDELSGHNDCRQYNAVLQYESVVSGEYESVKVQVAIREPIIESTVSCSGDTLLRQPTPEEGSATDVALRVMSLHETYAEKIRAALTRDPPAIRDVFDIAEALKAERLDFTGERFLGLVRQKLTVAGNAAPDADRTRRTVLEAQLETDLKPVLRSRDYAEFDFEHAFAELERIADLLKEL